MRDFSESLSFLFELFLISLYPSRLFDHLHSPTDFFASACKQCALVHLTERALPERLPHLINFLELLCVQHSKVGLKLDGIQVLI